MQLSLKNPINETLLEFLRTNLIQNKTIKIQYFRNNIFTQKTLQTPIAPDTSYRITLENDQIVIIGECYLPEEFLFQENNFEDEIEEDLLLSYLLETSKEINELTEEINEEMRIHIAEKLIQSKKNKPLILNAKIETDVIRIESVRFPYNPETLLYDIENFDSVVELVLEELFSSFFFGEG